MARYRMRVYLYAFGFSGSSHDFSALMGADSDRQTPECGDWSYDSRMTDSGDLEQHVLWLIQRFTESIRRARAEAPQAQFQVNVCLEMVGNLAPAANLSRETIRQMASLGLSIDVDLYAFESDDKLKPLANYRCVMAEAAER